MMVSRTWYEGWGRQKIVETVHLVLQERRFPDAIRVRLCDALRVELARNPCLHTAYIVCPRSPNGIARTGLVFEPPADPDDLLIPLPVAAWRKQLDHDWRQAARNDPTSATLQ